ncbi:RidA family protein [Silvibacterium acidisoli]|uniref:RidA family protein n=1 Tax=Acidobacteriaceae bacterium ZG23-2 TaxID=2883246 RepID=UPI00406D463B
MGAIVSEIARFASRKDVLHYLQMSAQSPEERIAGLGHKLPELPSPGGNYLSAKVVGNMIYLAGVVSQNESSVMGGTIGQDRTIEEGYIAAQQCALIQLAVLRQALGSLDRIVQIVTVNGYVNAASGFPDSPRVINGASDLLIEVFGERGRHVRAAVGVSALPRNAMVEIQMTAEIR